MQLAVFFMFFVCLHSLHFWECSCQSPEFNLDGDYLIGGLFPVHYAAHSSRQRRPVAVKCNEKPFFLTGYHLLQVMRFAVEEINNSTTLLPNVTLGYQLFDHCSNTLTFPSSLQFLSHNASVKAKDDYYLYLPKVIGVTGPLSSSESITLAPLFMTDLIPMVNYGASSSVFSDKVVYPSFIRTVPSNKDQIQLIVHIIKHFGWNWVAFIGSESAYSLDGFQLFYKLIQSTGICLAYYELLSNKSQLKPIFDKIDMLHVNVIILFLDELKAEEVIAAAIRHKFRAKVWIAGEAWSMYQPLTRLPGIETIGTVIGVTPRVGALPGFTDFIHQSRTGGHAGAGLSDSAVCNQDCETCSSLNPEDIISESTAYSFSVYSAVYTMAMALHNALQCNNSGCDKSRTVYPYMILQEIKRLPVFPLSQLYVSFDQSGDPPAHYSVIFWDTTHSGLAKIRPIGTYDNHPSVNLTIDDTQIHWHGDGLVPFSNCSVECRSGHVRQQDGQHECCFSCVQCSTDQYANHSADLYSCLACDEFEWSEAGSTTCQKRSVEYLPFSDVFSILVLVSASSLIALSLAVTVLFAIHRSTPVVRSAGGSMCFLMLGCMAGSAASVCFHFGEPSALSCALRNTAYIYFYTACLSCLTVRSFQIICVFKMAAHLPRAHALWVKYSGQWLVVAGVSLLQLVFFGIEMAAARPVPVSDTSSFKDLVVLTCFSKNTIPAFFSLFFMGGVSALCLLFSYMGTDLPKNYNEAKAITFSILLCHLSWVIFVTADVISRSKYVQFVKAVSELSSLYGIMFSYFIPKSFIIVFHPLKNTQEYFQAAIQSYTQTISRM